MTSHRLGLRSGHDHGRLAIFLLALVPFSVSMADSMRCDKWVVNETVALGELIDKCGTPTSKTVSTEDVQAVNAATGASQKTGKKVTERWLYRRGTQIPMVVTIVDGKIQSIERTE